MAGCREFEVGYAGLKDRRALALQWFSVPRTAGVADWSSVRGEGFEVLEAFPHARKLPRGALAGNRFAVRARGGDGEGAALAARLAPRLAQLAARGVPNYFGPQRFGRDGANLAGPAAALGSLRREQRGFVLSAARSALFNAVLAARVADGSWEGLLPGDLADARRPRQHLCRAGSRCAAGGALRDGSRSIRPAPCGEPVSPRRSRKCASSKRPWPAAFTGRLRCAPPRACATSDAACA